MPYRKFSSCSALADFPTANCLAADLAVFPAFFVFLSRPPFTAYNQKELAEKIREGKFRRIPYRYSEELNTLLGKMLNLKVGIEFIFKIYTIWCLSYWIILDCIKDGLHVHIWKRESCAEILQTLHSF